MVDRIAERRVGVTEKFVRIGATAALVATLSVAARPNQQEANTAHAQTIVRVNDIPPDKLIEYDGPVESYCQQGDTVGLEFASGNTFWWVERFLHTETREVAHQRQLAETPDCRPLQEEQPVRQTAVECPVNWEMPRLFTTTSVPSVGVTNIDIARPERGFNWRDFPSGMRAFFAEPGGFLADRNKIPADRLAEWDNIVRNSNGAVNFINPQNQQVFQRSEFAGSIPWKGYAMFSLEEGRLTVPDEDACLTVTLLPRDGRNNYLVVIKGRNGDEALNRTAQWDRAVGGHALYQRYDRAAFISADQLNQLAIEASNIASRVTVVGLDLNTRAMMLVEQDRGGRTWRWINANYIGV